MAGRVVQRTAVGGVGGRVGVCPGVCVRVAAVVVCLCGVTAGQVEAVFSVEENLFLVTLEYSEGEEEEEDVML